MTHVGEPHLPLLISFPCQTAASTPKKIHGFLLHLFILGSSLQVSAEKSLKAICGLCETHPPAPQATVC